MPGFLDRLRGKPPSPQEAERRTHEKEEHERRKRELAEQEKEARYRGYKKARLQAAERKGAEQGRRSSMGWGERLSGALAGTGGGSRSGGSTGATRRSSSRRRSTIRSENRDLDRLMRPPQFKGRTRRKNTRSIAQETRGSLFDTYQQDMDEIMR